MPDEITGPNERLPLFRRSYETGILVAELDKLDAGQQVSYAELSKLAGFKVEGKSYPLLSARRILRSESGKIIDCVYGVGVKRLTDTEIVQAASHGVRSLSRRAWAESDRLTRADFAALDEAARKKYATHQSIFGAVAIMASSKGIAVIEKGVTGSAKELPIKETLLLFQE